MSEREQIVARLADLQAKQEAATGWGAAVGAREEEIRSLESRLLRIDAMTAPPSTETPRHTATPIAWVLPGDDTAYGDGWIDARIDEYSEFTRPLYSEETVLALTSSHASLTARVAELDRMLAEAADMLNRSPQMAAMDLGAKITAYRLAKQKAARAALDNADGGRG